MRILIIEDDKKTASYLKKGLSENGFVADVFNRGDDGLHAALTGEHDLIILDVMLPGKDGFEICRRIREREKSREIPILFLSATTEPEERVEGLRLGAVDFISKPFQREDLLIRVGIHLELARLRTKLENLVEQRTAEL